MFMGDNTSINSDDNKSQLSIKNDISITDDDDALKKSSGSITLVDNVILTSSLSSSNIETDSVSTIMDNV